MEITAYKIDWSELATANHGDAVKALSSVFIIAQSDTRNEYLIRWLQKISLEQLLFQ